MYFTYERPDFNVNDPAEIRRIIEEAYCNGCESTHAGKPADFMTSRVNTAFWWASHPRAAWAAALLPA